MFNRTATRHQQTASIGDVNPLLKYPHRLNFYEEAPLEQVTLEQFETWAIDRLRVLAEIEAARIRGGNFEALKTVVSTQCEKHLQLHSNSEKEYNLDEERWKDRVSHFILRLAFCRTDELRGKFVRAETDLFRVRFAEAKQAERDAFLASKRFSGEPISDDEKAQLKRQLMDTTFSIRTEEDFAKENFYRVPWTKVTDLVAQRRVFLKRGHAYVPSTLQSSIIFQEFQARLANALELTARALPRLDEDDRLLPIITHFSQGFLAGVAGEHGRSVGQYGDAVTADMIDDLAWKHFPLCMRHVHGGLRQNRHLKHQGRLQYTLFLKVLGLPIDEAIHFWRASYGNTMSDDRFNKEYRYNIRHSYGLEGGRKNYPARDCRCIIMENPPAVTETHGCPFRHFSTSNLQSAINGYYGIPIMSEEMSDIIRAVEMRHYHVACTRVFELTHDGEGLGDGESVTHPNKYVARSRELEKEKEAKKEVATEGIGNTLKPDS
ncbi:eukaryotic and archaeal DNA primase, large subunit-domain-containing protein [Cantharellus anzutake]|uniref:eukaryotic and archaeal DNA primase, large subunit-domain-containing protein n=1 Tax=Cantharellus anzutake TaxID=1750568 RepID=UPI0019042926|nr:eukaryotic and archaeal DNA primase, large subunit-domain-containing protein [Cantharellus anzutake]KAF8324690.1 eukaryotic and archaeal DNA primase, large subunit-domain-containing protein [Cantharellus anzutake]